MMTPQVSIQPDEVQILFMLAPMLNM